ncbi:cation-translocating P-type ATPase [soil metagenome]
MVVGDVLMASEGTVIAADGTIISSNDFSVNESLLTGESLSVFKNASDKDNRVYSGTTVSGGLALIKVTATGNQTQLGKISKSLLSIKEEKTPLELQVNNFVKKMAIAGAIVFLIVWLINFFKTYNFADSLLKALTLAMSILPEEVPVALTTFMALGAWRLMKAGIIVKQMKTIETLGSATVICVDKTGTITENEMSIAKLWTLSSPSIADADHELTQNEKELIISAMWASEPIPFDAMEVALHNAYSKFCSVDERVSFSIIHEYPLSGIPPMMTHIFESSSGNRIIAAKGAPEAIIEVCELSFDEKTQLYNVIDTLTTEGYRLLGVSTSEFSGNNFPADQQQFKFTFKGIIAFYDPPKKNIQSVLQSFYNAGINIKIITGDNAKTTTAIAKQIDFKDFEKSISGIELMELSDGELFEKVIQTNIFTRMFPDAKLRIINALKQQGQIVAMTGDGVNDAPALKAAHIGIAMGSKGTEIAKQAASLILSDDDLSKMITAIAAGRKIYNNLKKAIQYIISIHIPIILTVFIPLALNWIYPNIFSPVHVIFLEMIMGPTCSIIYENEPVEKNIMFQLPRPLTNTFFKFKELVTSIVQGLVIAGGTLLTYRYAVSLGYNADLTRTMVFTTLVVANIFLTLVNRSFYYSLLITLRYKNNLVPIIIGLTVILVATIIYLDPLTELFQFQQLQLKQLSFCMITGFISVVWYELVKFKRRGKDDIKKSNNK